VAWDDLRYVLAVAEQGTLSGAARSLGVNHSTVLRRISAFEDKKGVRVFERTGTGYTLRPESNHLLNALRTIEDQVHGLDRAIARQGLELDGPVRITTTDTFAAAGFMKHVAHFQQQHPGVIVELNTTNSYVDFSRLEADITVRPTLTLPPEMEGERACEIVLKVYGTPEYLGQNTGTSYAAHKWLGVGPPISTTLVGDWQRQHVPDAAIILKSNSFADLGSVAATGLGLAMLPCCIGDPSPDLVRAENFPDSLTSWIWVATHRDMSGSAKVQSILRYFASAIRGDADLFAGRVAGESADPVGRHHTRHGMAENMTV